jgi:hypothetical protein
MMDCSGIFDEVERATIRRGRIYRHNPSYQRSDVPSSEETSLGANVQSLSHVIATLRLEDGQGMALGWVWHLVKTEKKDRQV